MLLLFVLTFDIHKLSLQWKILIKVGISIIFKVFIYDFDSVFYEEK